MQYIFYSEDGYCESPRGEKIENFQVLGITSGNNEQQAYENLLKENEWIKEYEFKESSIFYKMIIPCEIKKSLDVIIKYLLENKNKYIEKFGAEDNIVDILNHLDNIEKFIL